MRKLIGSSTVLLDDSNQSDAPLYVVAKISGEQAARIKLLSEFVASEGLNFIDYDWKEITWSAFNAPFIRAMEELDDEDAMDRIMNKAMKTGASTIRVFDCWFCFCYQSDAFNVASGNWDLSLLDTDSVDLLE